MSRYINREEALSFPFANGQYDHKNADENFILGCESYKEWLENLPTADAIPVVHGRWIQDGEPPMFSLTCSVCGQKYFNHYLQPHANYCSMCGAKMDEVTE